MHNYLLYITDVVDCQKGKKIPTTQYLHSRQEWHFRFVSTNYIVHKIALL